MGILFGFKADAIATKVTDSFSEADSTLVVSTPLTVDPITDAVNNVRFACNGFAMDGALAAIEMRTRSTFKFRIPQAGRITVFGHLTYFGVSTVGARRHPLPLFPSGFCIFQLFARMRVRVRGADDQIVFTRSSSTRFLCDRRVSGGDGTRSETDIVAAALMEEFLTVVPPDVVLPEHTIYVRLQYNVNAFAISGEFVLDFDSAGGGLNVPMVVVNF